MYRKSKLSDCREIYNLICEMESTQLPFDRFSKIYNKQLDNSCYYCLVCEYEDKIIGILKLRFEEQLHHAKCIAEIMEFVVSVDYRKRGFGKDMFLTACQIAKEYGCTQIEVASNQRRKLAHNFYEREGMNNSHYKFSKDLIKTDLLEDLIKG